MQWINTRQTYGWLSIILHWLAAAAVIYLLWLGFNMDAAEEAHNRALHHSIEELHISVGMTVILLLAARVIASYAQPRPEAPEQSAPLKLVSVATHQVLLILIVLQIVTGPLMEWASAHPIQVWDWFAIPSPFAERNHGLHEAMEFVHKNTRWVFVVLIALHTLGALKHAMIDRDGVFRRMLVAGYKKA
jgi:cytochrome b561